MELDRATESITIRSTYQAAKEVADKIEKHFIDSLFNTVDNLKRKLECVPTAQLIEEMINVAFWASLRKEEGHSPKVSLAFLPPEQSGQPVILSNKILLTPNILTKLAPAVEPLGIHLGIWHEAGELYIWGTTRLIPGFSFVLEVVEPGLLVIKHGRIEGYGKFVNVAVLKGDQIKIIDQNSGNMPDCPLLLTSLLGFTTPLTWNNSVNVLIQLASSMRTHKRGGTLLVVPSQNYNWRESVINPISYPIDPSNYGLNEIMQKDINKRNQLNWQAELNGMVESIAGLTAIDGTTIINDKHELLAFGVKTGRAASSVPVEKILITEPIIGGEAIYVHPSQNGGTRHLSAAQFVFDQRDSIALVASQDGRFTIFSWSPCEEIVHAHRIDSLLL